MPFNFMLYSPAPTEKQVLQQCDGTSRMPETDVTTLGVTMDDKLTHWSLGDSNLILGRSFSS